MQLGLLVLLAAWPGAFVAAADVGIAVSRTRIAAPVSSFLDFREARLVRQGWDISCGAAALSTVLTYELGRPYSEATIAVSILANSDPAAVRARGGFSLLDLKRFAEAVGLQAMGYGDMTLDDLVAADAPAILPVRIRGFDHFVVFRRALHDRVELGDPAFGNMLVSASRFEQMWPSGIAFYVRDPGRIDPARGVPAGSILAVSDLKAVFRLLQARRLDAPAARRPAMNAR